MTPKYRADGSVDKWGYPDAEGNPMTTLSDLMTSKSHVPSDSARRVFVERHMQLEPDGSLIPSDDDIHARRERYRRNRRGL